MQDPVCKIDNHSKFAKLKAKYTEPPYAFVGLFLISVAV